MRPFTQQDIDEAYEDELDDLWCPLCKDAGYHVKLGRRILEQNEPIPADYENWLQCPKCYWICPIYEVEKEATINNAIETVESPFETKTIIQSPHEKRGKKVKRHLNKKTIHQETDKDILREIKKFGEQNVHVIQDSGQ